MMLLIVFKQFFQLSSCDADGKYYLNKRLLKNCQVPTITIYTLFHVICNFFLINHSAFTDKNITLLNFTGVIVSVPSYKRYNGM